MVALALLAASCAPAPSPSAPPPASPAALTASPTATPTAGLRAVVPVRAVTPDRLWHTVPNALHHDPASFAVAFDGDPTAGVPRLRIDPLGREIPLQRDGATWHADVDLAGIAPGRYKVGVTERVSGSYVMVNGTTAGSELVVSAPVYVVWTLDFEGDAAGDAALANTAAIADGLHIPATVMWNPRVWTTPEVLAQRADAMVAWTLGRAAKGDDVALHVHAWTDFVRAAGVAPRTVPNWSGRSDGYDVPLTAFSEQETAKLVAHALALMKDHGMPRPAAFRGGGLFANAGNLRAIAAAGFAVDTSATPAGAFGRLPLPWTLSKDAQPYHPSRDDANAPGDLPLLEVPNIAGNTYGYTAASIQRTINDDLAMLPSPGQPATAVRVLTLVSHPATIDDTERAAIEKLFRAFDAFRFDRDAGPLRFVTMSQLVAAYR